MAKDKFILSKSGLMNLSFQYPSSWEMKEIDNPKANYRQIHLVGPRREEIGFPVSLTITTFSQSKNLKDEVDRYLSRKKRLKDFNLLNRSDAFWANKPAEVVEFTYLISLPLYATETQKVKIKERAIFLKKGDVLYKISYFVDQERFADFVDVLDKLKNSFSFLN